MYVLCPLMSGIRIWTQHRFKLEHSLMTMVLSMCGAAVTISFLHVPAHTKSWSGLRQSKTLTWNRGPEL